MRLLEESRRRAEEKEERLRASRQSTRMLFGRDLELPLLQGNAEVGRLRARVRADALVQEVLARTLGEQGEVPFALDSEGKLHTLKEEDSSLLEQFPLADLSSQHPTLHTKHWVVATTEDEQSGMRFGIARPIDKDVASISLAAARNFAMGLALIVLAILGILPFSNRITRNLHLVIAGAERIAAGDLTARVPVRTRDEFGQLASTFNSMAQQLSENQERLLEEERRRLLLAAENDRKSRELEGARELQLSLLPRTLPTNPAFELAVHMRTATEVGGDYYDFQLHQDGTLVMAIGDATGHGLRAGTLVTAIKSLFANYHPNTGPHHFLTNASATLRRLDLGRLAMALTLVELRGDHLTVAAGGIPPLLIHRAQRGTVEEFLYPGLPLGVPLPFVYQSHHVCLSPGDTLLLTTDGFAELLNPKGDLLGYDRVRDLFREAVEGGGPQAVIDHLEKSLDRWTEGEPPADDVTFVVLQRFESQARG
jgi:serine phosphatase RsbU (regulator of sigma subunit)